MKFGKVVISLWSQAIVIPIQKPGKYNTDPNNYRPIALTSCIYKTMEMMINKRLVWFLKTINILTNIQCGFRKNRSTVDQLFDQRLLFEMPLLTRNMPFLYILI